MKTFYDPIEPYDEGMLAVSSIHTIYYEQSGNPEGNPVVFLHGGPGGGTTEDYRRFFDPKAYRIILFDQRGSGKSTPYACLEENTTWDLVSDIEKLREHLRIEKWVVFGGSWGSTLSLAYAESHPERVKAIILRGIFLVRKAEIDWFYQQGANAVFPDFWEAYLSLIPVEERSDMVEAYYRRLTSADEATRFAAAKAWSIWEGSTSKLYPDQNLIDDFASPDKAVALARIECHYFLNNCFFDSENYLIDNIARIRHIPTVIVQGRYDMVCPIMSAWALHEAFPEAELVVVPDAGHSAFEKGNLSALVDATDKFKSL
jgi:proline iminopeptidase